MAMNIELRFELGDKVVNKEDSDLNPPGTFPRNLWEKVILLSRAL